ncbi:MAG TPA: hypothetical protein VGP84_07400, partial [Gemmatimonadaceae bacterium]|nr:hypothetical protein [Gemmatimonadaceae bacterium]
MRGSRGQTRCASRQLVAERSAVVELDQQRSQRTGSVGDSRRGHGVEADFTEKRGVEWRDSAAASDGGGDG